MAPEPVPTATVEPTATAEPTATDTLTPEPTATPKPTEPPPMPEQRKLAAAPTDTPALPAPEREESLQAESMPGEPAGGGAAPDESRPPPPPASEGHWLGWRIAQAVLGVLLAALVLAIAWLRIKGR
jgi:hypothetical protein